MLDLLWYTIGEGIQRFRKVEMLKWVCHLDLLTHPRRVQTTYLSSWLWEISLWGEYQQSWRALWSLFSVSQKTPWELLPLNWENKMQWRQLDSKVAEANGSTQLSKERECGYHDENQSQSSDQRRQSHRYLPDIGSLITVFVEVRKWEVCYILTWSVISERVLGQVNKSLMWTMTESWTLWSIPRLEPVYRIPWMKGRLDPLEKGFCPSTKNVCF